MRCYSFTQCQKHRSGVRQQDVHGAASDPCQVAYWQLRTISTCGTTAATSTPPFLTHYILIMHVKPFQPLLALVLYVLRCPLVYPPRQYYWTLPSSSCRRLTPLARAGMETPTGAHCLAKPATNTSPSTSPSLFPPVSFVPLSFSYFVSPSLCLYSFSFLFLWDSSTYSPFFWEWPSLKKQPHSGSPLYIVTWTGH